MPVIEVSSRPAGAGPILFDPAGFHADATLLTQTPSPDGRLTLVQMTIGSAVQILLLDAADGAIVRDFGQVIAASGIAWMVDGTGFYMRKFGIVSHGDGSVTPVPEIWWQPVVGDAERQPVEIAVDNAWAVMSQDGRWAAICGNQGSPRPLWIRRIDGGAWTPFLAGADAMYKGSFIGDEYWAITDDVSGWCRLVAIPIATADDRATWRELRAAQAETKLGAVDAVRRPCRAGHHRLRGNAAAVARSRRP